MEWSYIFKILKAPLKKKVKTNQHIHKVAKYKISLQSLVFLYTNNELSEKYVNKIILFAIALKTVKYLVIHLAK